MTALLAALWIISPLVLIPLLIVSISKYNQLKKRNEELEHALNKNTAVTPQPAIRLTAQTAALNTARPAVSVPAHKPVSAQTRAQAPTQTRKSTHQSSPISIVFGIGVTLVLLAALVFATTTWMIMSSEAKIIMVYALVLVFFTVSAVAYRKFHLRMSSMTFYMLGTVFVFIAFVGATYLKLFEIKDQFCLYHLYDLATFLILSVACMIGAKRYRSRLYIWLFYFMTFLTIGRTISIFITSADKVYLAEVLVCSMIYLFRNKMTRRGYFLLNEVPAFAKVVMLCCGIPVIFISFTTLLGNITLCDLLAMTVIMFLMTYHYLIEKGSWVKQIYAIPSVILINMVIRMIIGKSEFQCLAFVCAYFILFLLFRYLKVKGVDLFKSEATDAILLACIFCMGLCDPRKEAHYLSVALLLAGLIIKSFFDDKKLEKSTENNIGIKTLQTPNLVSLAFLSLSVLYIPIAIAYNSPELAFRNLFIIYYVFIAMISVLMMLYLDKNPKCYLLSRANTLLLFVVGAIMTIYELTTKNTFYPMVYLWIAALIISVYLYIAKKKRSWIYALSVTVTVALYCSVTYLFPMVKDMGAACICGSLFMVLLTVFLIATRLRKESLPFENDCFMILTALVHIFMLLCFTSWLKFPDTSCIIGALLLCMAAVCQWALYQKEHNISGMISLLTFFPIINKLADYAVFDTNMKMLLYIIIFGSFLLLGRLLYPERMIVISREE
ncbi:MAG: DUF2157 domain-containing protein, partial [Clostridia bacterium]|nr:DUF2157 domain-containing protein [Clostridia bacterium]